MEKTKTMTMTQSKPQKLSGPYRHPLGREDWWSEEATATLIEAWGNRYVKLNHGNLRQNDWREVSDAVNSRHSKNSRPKTDVQCKNRIDTLKKKYKTEKAKLSPSSWRFYDRLDVLIGPVLKKSTGGVVKSAFMNPYQFNLTGSKSTGSSLDDDDDDDEEVARKHPRVEEVDLNEGSTCRELAIAILKFGEVYERMEGKKQEIMIELENQRMEVTKEVELRRMNMLMEMQFELEKSKQLKRGSGKRL